MMSKSNLGLIVIIAIFAIIDWRIAVGIIIGYPFSLLHSWLLKIRFSNITTAKPRVVVYLGTIVSMLIFACPMLISMLMPQFVHFFGVFIGLIYHKYFLYVQAIRNKG